MQSDVLCAEFTSTPTSRNHRSLPGKILPIREIRPAAQLLYRPSYELQTCRLHSVPNFSIFIISVILEKAQKILNVSNLFFFYVLWTSVFFWLSLNKLK